MRDSLRPDHTCILTIQADRPGGVPTLVDWWYRFLTRWGHRATVLYAAFEEGEIGLLKRLGHTLRTWGLHSRPEHPNPTLANAAPPLPLWLFYFVPQWIAGPALGRFDQIVVASGSAHVALPLALRRRPFVLWVATLYEDELRGKALAGDEWAARVLESPFWPFLVWQERFTLRRASRILALSPYTRRRILEVLPEVEESLDLVMVPMDTERYRPLSAGDRNRRTPYLLNASRINDPRKNTPLLLEAFARVRERYPRLKLVLVGDEPQPALLDRCERLGLNEAVSFRGKVPEEELLALYRGAELFLIGSTQEGLGIVMLEAMASGTPVVATECGGPEGVVIDGETGRLVPNNDAEAMAQAIIELLSDPDRLEAMRHRCVNFVREHCSLPVVEAQLYRHFVEVFPDSTAAQQALFDVPRRASPRNEARQASLWRSVLAAAWAVFVFVMYMQHQMMLHWAAIRAEILEPLLDAIR